MDRKVLDILPENDIAPCSVNKAEAIATAEQRGATAKERALELQRMRANEKAEASEQKVETVEAIEVPLRPEDLIPTDSQPVAVEQALSVLKSRIGASPVPSAATDTKATTRKSVARLLTSLNINLDLQLTKADTSSLLSCLLTANEDQLHALMKNKKIPLAIKTVIKRLLTDAETGNMGTVEKLWDRIFGKLPLNETAATAEVATATQGLIPKHAVSRETYVLIKETLMG